MIRDCNGARSFDTLLRYRGGTLAELWRALRTLKALQAEARACAGPKAGACSCAARGYRSRPCGDARRPSRHKHGATG